MPKKLETLLSKETFAGLKLQSHYSDNQSPTSDNHFFSGWLPEVVRGRQMFVDDRRPVGDWLSENYIDNLSPTSDNHFFGVFFGGIRWSANDCR